MIERTIWKYELAVVDEQWIEMPHGAKPLTVAIQYDKPCMWCLVNPQNSEEPVHIITHGTGHPVPLISQYIGSYQLANGAFVGHVFTAS